MVKKYTPPFNPAEVKNIDFIDSIALRTECHSLSAFVNVVTETLKDEGVYSGEEVKALLELFANNRLCNLRETYQKRFLEMEAYKK
jgi:tRNA1(Val) A37 N6-methylase TrmN6